MNRTWSEPNYSWYLGFFQVLRVLEFHILNLILQFVNLLMKSEAVEEEKEEVQAEEGVEKEGRRSRRRWWRRMRG